MTQLAQSLLDLPFEERFELIWILLDSIEKENHDLAVKALIELEQRVDEILSSGNQDKIWKLAEERVLLRKKSYSIA